MARDNSLGRATPIVAASGPRVENKIQPSEGARELGSTCPRRKSRLLRAQPARSVIWWAKYYVNGRPIRESTGARKETKARRFLKDREGRVATGQPVLPRADRIRYEEIAQDLRRHYEATGTRDLKEFDYRVKHLDVFFTGRRVNAIGQSEVDAYIVKRQTEGAVGSTIRRELGTLTRTSAVSRLTAATQTRETQGTGG